MVTDLVTVPILLVTLGCVGLYTGWKRGRIHDQLTAAEPTPIRELASPSLVEVTGTATPASAPVVAPVTGRDAVVAAWTVEEWDERGDTARWREVARGVELPALDVDDGTGTVRIEAVSKRDTAGKWTQTTGVSAADGVRIDDVLAEFETFPVRTALAPDEEPPADIRRLHEEHGLYEETGSITNAVDVGKQHGRRRYAEGTVAPGEDLYVCGHVESQDNPSRSRIRPGEATVTTPPEGLFVVSDQDAANLAAEFESAARGRLVAGAIATVVGLGGLVYLLA